MVGFSFPIKRSSSLHLICSMNIASLWFLLCVFEQMVNKKKWFPAKIQRWTAKASTMSNVRCHQNRKTNEHKTTPYFFPGVMA